MGLVARKLPRVVRAWSAKHVVVLLALAVTGIVASTATARADSVSPNCIPTLSTPVTIQLSGITSQLDLQVFFLHHSLALTFQSQPPVLFGPTLSNESFSPAGFTATAVFDNPISGPPTASGLGEVVEFTVGPGVVQVTPIGPLIVSPNCAPPQHATSTSVSCSPSTTVAGQSATCTATVADTAGSGATSPSALRGSVDERPGGSAKPPAGVPQYMEVIASSRIAKRGSSLDGSTRHVVVVKTNPGGAGTGTVVAQAC